MTTPEHGSSGPDTNDDHAGLPLEQLDDAIEDTVSAGRPRVVTAEISRDRGWKSMVQVVIEREGRTAEARKDAVGEELVLFRCAAEATLDALHDLLGPPERFALVGAKRVLAFDSAVVLACVRTVGGRPRKLIGCVPMQEDAVLAVARAVLHATNRIVEGLPNGPSEADAPSDDSDHGNGD